MVSAILAVTIVGLGALIYIAGYYDTLVGSVGKDTTLSGRTFIWKAVWDQIQHKLWFGYGTSCILE